MSSAQLPPPDADRWTVAEGTVDGRRVTVRWDEAVRRQPPVDDRPVKVMVGVEMRAPRPDGLPSVDDLADLQAVEQVLVAELGEIADAAPVLVVTGNGLCEWISYAADHEWLEEWGSTFARRFGRDRQIAVEASADPQWATFRQWTTAQP